MLGLAPATTGESNTSETTSEQSEDSILCDLPQLVLQIVATSLQCDLLAGVLTNSTRLAETILCVPRGSRVCAGGQVVKKGQVVCYLEQLGTQQPVEEQWREGCHCCLVNPNLITRRL